MSITPMSPAINQQGWVQTWVTSQWKNRPIPGQFSAEINNIGSGSATVEVSVSFTDDLSGISSISVELKNPSGNNVAGANIWTVVSGTATHGTWKGVLTIPQYSETGQYSVDVGLWDTAGNSTYKSGVASFQVKGEGNSVVLSFEPADGSVLPNAITGERYSQTITASGGVGPISYQIVSGTLPTGLVLNASTGELTGKVQAGSEGSYLFAIEARDSHGHTGGANYTLPVNQPTVTAPNHQIEVSDGEMPPDVDLTEGATGGPFVAASIVSVEPAHAGTAEIVTAEFARASSVAGQHFYLKFTPNHSFFGQAKVAYQLTGPLGESDVGTVTYTLGYSASTVAEDVDELARGFVQARQNLIAQTIALPGLIERTRMEAATRPMTARMFPSDDGLTLNFASSLAQMNAAANAVSGLGVSGFSSSPFNIWVDGTLMAHNRDQNGNRWGSFGMISAGADYLINEKALIGLSLHFDRMTDPTDPDSQLTGNGWLAGPYASLELGKGVIWDTSLLYGGSSNTVDTEVWDGTFDTQRWMFDTAISGQWEMQEGTTFTPKLRAVYLAETARDYSVENSTGGVVDVSGFKMEQLRVSLGAELGHQFTLRNGSILTPKLGLTGGFSSLDGSGAYGQVSAGLTYQALDTWTFDGGLLFDVEGKGQQSIGARMMIEARF